MKREITLKDFDQFLAKENYEGINLAADVDLFLTISKSATKCGMKTVKNIHVIQLAAKLVALAIEDDVKYRKQQTITKVTKKDE